MPYSSDQELIRPLSQGGPDPFASLGAVPARRRFWLIELFTAPFQDHDERADYRAHQKGGKRPNGNGNGRFRPDGRRPVGR